MKDYREPGTIESVRIGRESDHGLLVCMLGFDFGGSWQSTAWCLGDEGTTDAMRDDMCRLFCVDEPEQIVGKRAFALYAFPRFGQDIIGVEHKRARIVLHDWMRRNGLPDCPDPLRRTIDSLNRDIAWARRRIVDNERRLVKVRDEYIDWTTQPYGEQQ